MKKITLLFFSVLFSVGLFSQDPTITSFTLVNADSNDDILEISEGTEINLLEYPGVEFNIRANTSNEVKSVRLKLTGTLTNTMTESAAPYALYGDFPAGDYEGQVFPEGSYTILGVPFSEVNGGGTKGQRLLINFKMVKEPIQRPFVTTWKTDNPGSSGDNQITIPTFEGEEYDYTVNWGDGSSDTNVTGDITHTYAETGRYRVSISGEFPRIYFHNNFDSSYAPGPGDKDKLIEVNQWGDIQWTSMRDAFYGCSNMDMVATDKPDFSNLSSLSFMFADCKSMIGNGSFAEWNIGNVSNISFMFSGAKLFNQDIGQWNTSNVVQMQSIFSFTDTFNQPVGQWDLSNARSVSGMFLDAIAFNQDIGAWKFPNVTEIPNMFSGALAFNQNISTWDVATITNFGAIFANAAAFNQDLSSWDVSNATTLSAMFLDSGLSDENYDKLLIGWSQLPSLQNGVQIDANQNAYCNAVDERQFIIDTYGWIINDLGQAFNCGPNQQRPFVTVWKTDNTGISENNQITIPTFSAETYNYFVDWGDGTSSENISGDITHTYQNSGIYTISVLGEFPRIYFDNAGDKEKLLRIEQWGDLHWTSMENAFSGCSLMDVTAEDVPDLSQLVSMKGMFQGCSSLVGNYWITNWDTSAVENMADLFRNTSLFNQYVGTWDVSNVKFMNYMFANASSFNQHLASWNVGSVESMDSMLDGTILSILNYDRTLIAWKNLGTLQQNVSLGAGGLNFCQSATARQRIIETYNWNIFDDMQSAECPTFQRPFITTWKTDNLGNSNDNQVTIPTASFETYDFTVVWGDGTVSENITESITHTYAAPGVYTVAISGFYPTPYFNNGPAASDVKKLLTVEQWGDVRWTTMGSAFLGCENLDVIATDVPDFSNVTSTTAMFADCRSLIGNSYFEDWDMSQVKFVSSMFQGAEVFNQDISNWKMDNVELMSGMFQGAAKFNQPIGSWNITKVRFILGLFEGATSFNQPINDWDISNVDNLFGLFYDASSFNQPLNNWKVDNVTTMASLFYGATAFDQDLSSWNVSQVQNMASMFGNAGLSNENYDLLLNSWSTQALQNGVNFSAGSSQYCLGEEARQKLIDDFGWTILDGGKVEDCEGPQRPFIMTWKTDNPGVSEDNQITIPTFKGEVYNYMVDWGDGSSDKGITGDITHTYANPGTYQVSISGEFPRIYFNDTNNQEIGDEEKIISIDQWGSILWNDFGGAFAGCRNLQLDAEDIPDLSNVRDTGFMFGGCSSLVGNSSMNEWDLSGVVRMNSMFHGAVLFNADISRWDVSAVSEFGSMFWGASSFNQDIGDWNVESAITMNAMFNHAASFNGNIGSWNVSQVTDFILMFGYATNFNQNLENWDLEQVIEMQGMFAGAVAFDQSVGSWNISNVTDLTSMFEGVELSKKNYDSTLIAWSQLQFLHSGVVFDGGLSQYCSGEAARQKLIDDYGWIITDGGISLDCNPCPTTEIILNTQQQVDDFAITYDIVNCTFEGGIRIEGPDIVNLDGLSGLSFVGGVLNIVNTQVTNLDGLSSVSDVGTSLLIQNNALLEDIDGLSSITSLNQLSIIENDQLTNVNGLSLLNSISRLSISGNPSLIDIDGLNALTRVFGDLIIENNISLRSLEGLSLLLVISDSLIIRNNASLTNLDGLSSLVIIDNDLIVVSNQALTNLDGLSNLDGLGSFLTIQSNPVLENVDGLSSVTNMFGLSIIDNDMLTNLGGLTNVNFIGGDVIIIGNRALSDCAIDAVCDSETIVMGAVTISGNTGTCMDETAARAACTGTVEVSADLLAATYLEGSKNPMPLGPILRVEKGNRETYLKFDMSNINGTITEARLEMQVASDPGNGNLQVFLGSSSAWTETGLNGSNKPGVVGNALAAINGIYTLGQTKVWNLDVGNLSSDDALLTLIMKQSNGNDVAFASDETARAPKLFVTYSTVPEVQRPFITTWKTDNPGVSEDNQITIPTFPGETYNYTVAWGDGTSDSGVIGDITHTYNTPGTYQVSITGVFPRISFEQLSQGANKVVSIDQWGDIKWNSMHRAFYQSNLEVLAMDVPDLSNVEDISGMFLFCPSLKGNESFGNWDTSNVRNMDNLFAFTDFNQDVGNWDTSNVESMFAVFIETPFNQDISGWDVSKVQNTVQLFSETPFNQNISNWDVSEVIDMNSMFERSPFDQDISEWQIGKVTDMSGMFYETGMSTSNYDATLMGWSSQQLQSGVVFDGGNSQYCLGEVARQKLSDDFGWIITDGGKATDCSLVVEGEADLIHATYLQRANNPQPNGPLLRVEKGIRETYLKFDLSDFSGSITEARLEMQVASDPGNGTVEVFLGSNSNWSETGLNGSNKPIGVGVALAAIGGSHAVGQTKVWNLDVASLSTGGQLTLIVKQSSGNDVAFASDETFNPPRLVVTTTSINTLGSGASLSGILSLSPNPAVNEVRVSFVSPEGVELVNDIMVYDTTGRLVRTVSATEADIEGAFEIDVRSLQSGIYFIRTYDENGVPYQKQMAIER